MNCLAFKPKLQRLSNLLVACVSRETTKRAFARMIELQLPYPPSTNNLWVRSRFGMRRSDRYMAWLQVATYAAYQQKPKKLKGLYKLSIQAARQDKRRRDIDNIIKAISDLLQTIGVIKDDCDCEMVSARWVTTGNGVNVRVEQAGIE